jgi:hypothetical protein
MGGSEANPTSNRIFDAVEDKSHSNIENEEGPMRSNGDKPVFSKLMLSLVFSG